ncbi:helix-turn-helix domain-containing protein [Mesorhizobium sp. KR1-2]|uniref:helix-turn-helix domain-containing protein n=1 Tax=Mesorhizobium sp. KR1-2 TaxID=3156609 RepID=UPI0032B4E5E1
MLAYANSRDVLKFRSSVPGWRRSPPLPPQSTCFFAAGCEIYSQGEKAGSIYQVVFGAVRVYRLMRDGRRQISSFCLAGETFGFEEDSTHRFFAEAINATGLRKISLAESEDLSSELLPLALHSLIRTQDHLLVLGRQAAAERVAAFLVDMAQRQGRPHQIDLPMPRMDIGDYLGLAIETVSRVFSTFRETGIIRLHGLRGVEIVKWDALLNLSE